MESFDTSTAFGRAIVGILAAFAQLERENIKERTTMGRHARLAKGTTMVPDLLSVIASWKAATI